MQRVVFTIFGNLSLVDMCNNIAINIVPCIQSNLVDQGKLSMIRHINK